MFKWEYFFFYFSTTLSEQRTLKLCTILPFKHHLWVFKRHRWDSGWFIHLMINVRWWHVISKSRPHICLFQHEQWQWCITYWESGFLNLNLVCLVNPHIRSHTIHSCAVCAWKRVLSYCKTVHRSQDVNIGKQGVLHFKRRVKIFFALMHLHPLRSCL